MSYPTSAGGIKGSAYSPIRSIMRQHLTSLYSLAVVHVTIHNCVHGDYIQLHFSVLVLHRDSL